LVLLLISHGARLKGGAVNRRPSMSLHAEEMMRWGRLALPQAPPVSKLPY